MITKQTLLRVSILVGLLILFAAFTVPNTDTLVLGQAYAEDDDDDGESACSLKTIKGTYIFEAQGVIIDEDENVQSYAEAGIWTLDGEGNAAGVISVGIAGENFATKEPFTAEYELVSDCVFEVKDEFGLVVDLYTTPSGQTITYYSPGFSGTQFRQ